MNWLTTTPSFSCWPRRNWSPQAARTASQRSSARNWRSRGEKSEVKAKRLTYRLPSGRLPLARDPLGLDASELVADHLDLRRRGERGEVDVAVAVEKVALLGVERAAQGEANRRRWC